VCALLSAVPLSDAPPAQAKRLDELEKLYREEQVSRKRAFNMMEDLKGKIRVYCRVRPILKFEQVRAAFPRPLGCGSALVPSYPSSTCTPQAMLRMLE